MVFGGQIPEWEPFLQYRFIYRIYCVSLIQRSKNPNITQIGSCLSGQRTSILFQRSQVQIPEWATFLQFRFIFRIYYVSLIKRSKNPNIMQIGSHLSGQRTSILFQRSQVQIPEWEPFLQFRFIYRIYCVSLIQRSKNPNITQIGSRLSGQRTSILFQRS
jgi:hypothetical protein